MAPLARTYWISPSNSTLPDDQDILTGRLERATRREGLSPSRTIAASKPCRRDRRAGGRCALTLLLMAGRARRRHNEERASGAVDQANAQANTKPLRRVSRPSLPLIGITIFGSGGAEAQTAVTLPSVPATMATDVPQRMADGSLFVPKATQHLLSVRTVLTAKSRAPRTAQLVGTLIADPNSFGRVQTGHAGRIDPPESGLALCWQACREG